MMSIEASRTSAVCYDDHEEDRERDLRGLRVVGELLVARRHEAKLRAHLLALPHEDALDAAPRTRSWRPSR